MEPQPSPSYASALSLLENAEQAVAEVCQALQAELSEPPAFAVVFVSADRAAEMEAIAALLRETLKVEVLLGCTAESLVGSGREVEGQTGLSVWAACLPGVTLTPMRLSFERSPDGGAILGWPVSMADSWPEGSSLLMLADPFSFPADALLETLADNRPNAVVAGGMASGAGAPGESRLILGGEVFTSGAVGVLVAGVPVRTIVSQGCRPIGKPYVITKAERNVIHELGGKPAYEQLKQLFSELPTHEQQMAQRGLHVGRVVNEYQESFSQGDFLVRNVVGVDPEEGSIAIGDYVRVGQTVQFQIRDGESADIELRQMLAAVEAPAPGAALLFTCNGRGTRLFQEPHHDAQCIGDAFGPIPLAGFFAAGEIGPVGGRNFTHGFTASVVLFG
ncbi:FIST signal transduction protein [Lignipirellula cremea]|uniref:FIST N domain protein n=1 Tax=Lignipirellula cremea TaxID=2528010 RepID=A0A518DNU2_9BACT|nr:FIST N-terminal domain-containing protein [Lignipirellula cremea]QDU93509.1 FIST N domain protein [Lignipirellula cremea]